MFRRIGELYIPLGSSPIPFPFWFYLSVVNTKEGDLVSHLYAHISQYEAQKSKGMWRVMLMILPIQSLSTKWIKPSFSDQFKAEDRSSKNHASCLAVC